jgi:microsomal dipeptidase-like Zn-dependent dipeptidase
MMNRRRFIGYGATTGVVAAFRGLARGSETSGPSPEDAARAEPLLIADAHAHPNQLHGSRTYDPSTPTLDIIRQAGMTLCAFSAVGDMVFHRGRSGSPFRDTQDQLRQVTRLEEKGELRPVSDAAGLRAIIATRGAPGSLKAIEGGDALEGNLRNLDAFHDDGVRMMTLVHDRDNEIGCNQRSNSDGPLTRFGVRVVERMNSLGMLVDVAHAKGGTLKGIAEACARPLVDSHTSPLAPGEDGPGLRRLRPWQELELIAKTGGIVCTWPFAYSGNRSQRTTLQHWAREIAEMKRRLGIEHCGLGTDGGGGLPRLVDGWRSIASLPELMAAMGDAGLTQKDIAAYVGGNFLRLLEGCLA